MRYLAVCVLWGFACVSYALDGARAISQYGHDQWNHQSGLKGGTVYSIVHQSHGYLWLRTARGLVRFDGVRFVEVPLRVGDEIVNESPRSVTRSVDGKLLIRTMNRNLYGERTGFSDASAPLHLPDGLDRVVFESSDRAIWIGSDSSVYRYFKGNMEYIATRTGWVTAFIEDKKGNVWIGANTGLFRYRDNKLWLSPSEFSSSGAKTVVPLDESMFPFTEESVLKSGVLSLAEDSSGTIWIGTRKGLFKCSDGKVTADQKSPELNELSISCLLFDHDDNLWAGTEGNGLFRRTDGKWTRIDSRQGLGDDSVFSLCEDSEGSLWIGTRKGLDRLRDTPLLTLTTSEGMSNDNVCAVTESNDGSIFAYTAGGGVMQINGRAIKSIGVAQGLPSDYAGTLYAARDGSVWVGADQGLSQIKNGEIKTYTNNGHLKGTYISAICEDDESIIVFTSELKSYRFKDGQFSLYDFRIRPSSASNNFPYAYSIHSDEIETLWFGLTAGLYRVDRGQAPELATRMNYRLPVYSLFDDNKGSLWLTSSDARGISRVRKSDGQLVNYGAEAGVDIDEISRVLCDSRGDLWLGTRSGIMTIPRKDLDDYAEGRIKKVDSHLFGMIDGMRSEEAAGLTQQPAAWRSKDGRLYFATRKGLVVINPEHFPRNTHIPAVFVEEVLVDNRDAAIVGPLKLQPGKENFEFHYTALSMLVPERVKFKYQLVGYDSDWVDAGTRRTAYYTHVPAGNYVFRVKACNNDGVWNEEGASVEFTVLPRFFKTIWFYSICLVTLAALILGLHHLRLRRLQRREVELVATVDERTRKLQDEVTERAQTEKELQKYKEYLEQLVNERTTALRESYAQLQIESAERRSGEEALRQSEDRYRRFFEENLAGAFIASPQGKLLTCNPSFARIFGLEIGEGFGNFDLTSAFSSKEEADQLIARIATERKVQDCELELRRHDGSPVHILASLIGSFADNGELMEIKGYVLDATDRKKLETQLRQSQKMEAIGQLAGGVAHDFNNLLTAILGCSECLIDGRPADDDVAMLGSEIRDAGLRAAALTRQLLAFSRKQVLQLRVLNLNSILTDMEKMLRRLIGEDIHLFLTQAENLGYVKADSGQIEQIILNLAINARDAMPRGGKLTIETANAFIGDTPAQKELGLKQGAYVRLTVSDTGCGMSPDVQAHVFEPFFTTKGAGKGTGLGLSTVYGIATQSNGHISFTSELGKGTTFNIYLPAVDAQQEPNSLQTDSPASKQGSERILIVEDNELVLNIARRSLKLFGYDVVEASDSAKALEICSTEPGHIDLLLTDIVMPDINGRELAARIVKFRPNIKVLFMSGYTDDALRRLGDESTGVALLEKPFTPDSLAGKVREVLDGKIGV